VPDDGRARLPHDLEPGRSADVRLEVTAPVHEGPCVLEIDLVQERICWFAQRGSPTARQSVAVRPSRSPSPPPPPSQAPPAPASPGLLARIRQCFQGPAPFFEMHVVPRADVESTIEAAGATVVHAIDDGAAGAGWLSFTYVCRKA
jgi:hypothetical protein